MPEDACANFKLRSDAHNLEVGRHYRSPLSALEAKADWVRLVQMAMALPIL